jgi:bacillithiol system protein YtxJ
MLREIESVKQLDAVFGADVAVIYKHSPICGTSRWARGEVLAFVESHPDTPVYEVNVVSSREVSQEIARRLEVTHESPQVIVIQDGAVVWNASHSGVLSGDLARAVQDAAA